MKSIVLLICICMLPPLARASAAQAVALEKAGKYQESYAAFTALAETGDTKAMVDLGRFHFSGLGMEKDYTKAMDWWVKAFENDEGMAYNNIAVLYRDGLGVEKNIRIAWGLLFIGHMRGLGDQDAVMHINSTLRKLADGLDPQVVYEAGRWSEEYFKEFVRRRGADAGDYERLKHDSRYPPVIVLATY